MATQDDVRQMCLALPDTSEDSNFFRFFTEPHYDGCPAVQVTLKSIDRALLAQVIRQAWESRTKPGRPRK